MPFRTPEVVDAGLAAVSVATVVYLLHVAEGFFPDVAMFHNSMLSAAMAVCNNPVVPSPRAFLVTSGCGVVAGSTFHALGSIPALSGIAHTPAIIAALHLFFCKLAGASFGSTVNLAYYLSGAWAGWRTPLTFIFTPWLLGHCLLYAAASAAAALRRRVRVHLELRAASAAFRDAAAAAAAAGSGGGGGCGDATEARLRSLFDKYDTSGDGRLDALEFRVAYRVLTGGDISERDAADVIQTVHTSGDGTMDFQEFCAAVDPFVCGFGAGGGGASRYKQE